ncbi:acyltransferase domain-containing protein [Vallitalea sediminicola]
MKVVFMFSGQGSQYYNMGLDLYKNNTVFRKSMDKLDEVVKDSMGKSIIDVLYKSGLKNPFDNVLYTSVAIFMVEYSLANLLIENGINPDYVIGASIGEYTSAAVSNVMSYNDTIRSILKLSQLVKDSCKEGSMLAILENKKIYDDISILKNNSEMAAVNFDSHFVVSGSIEGINKIEKHLKSQEIICAKLPVRYAFHSSMMDTVAIAYKDYLRTKTFSEPQVNYISCVTGNHMKDMKNDYYWNTVRKPIQFQKAVNSLDINEEYCFIDVGPSGTLANFSKRIHGKGIKQNDFQIMTPFHNELKNLETIIKYFPNDNKSSI